MTKFATITLITLALIVGIVAAAANVEAKGPPGKVTISGGNLKTELVIDRPDLIQIDKVGYFDSRGTPYARTALHTGEVSYRVDVYMIEPNSTELQKFLSSNYFPANTSHPALLSDDGGLWKAQAVFASLLDDRIEAALSPSALPNAGGPSTSSANFWMYALAAGAILLLAPAPVLAHAHRKRRAQRSS